MNPHLHIPTSPLPCTHGASDDHFTSLAAQCWQYAWVSTNTTPLNHNFPAPDESPVSKHSCLSLSELPRISQPLKTADELCVYEGEREGG